MQLKIRLELLQKLSKTQFFSTCFIMLLVAEQFYFCFRSFTAVLAAGWPYFCYKAIDLIVGLAIDSAVLITLEVAINLSK